MLPSAILIPLQIYLDDIDVQNTLNSTVLCSDIKLLKFIMIPTWIASKIVGWEYTFDPHEKEH